MSRAKKAMLIGIDAPIAPRLYTYAQQGHMPCVKRLLDKGVYGVNCLPPFPTITPPNWTTLATGATSITHGISDFNVHVPGDELDRYHQAFDSADVHAEFIWEAVEKVGKNAIIVNYPASWPPRTKSGYQVFGVGLHPNECRRHVPQFPEEFKVSLAYEQLWTTDFKPLATNVEFRPARRWENVPRATRMLECELPLEYARALTPVEDVTWHALVLDTDGVGFDRVIVTGVKDCAKPLADLRVGQWSDTIVGTFHTQDGPRKAAFRLKLLALSPDGSQLELYRTSLCALDGWDYPEGLAAELPLRGLPLPAPGWQALKLGWIDLATLGEILEMSHEWLAEVARHLLDSKQWDLFYMHVHTTDEAYHVYSNLCDRQTAASEEEYRAYHAAELAMYESLDRLIARVISGVDEDETVILLVSDHGAKPSGTRLFIGQALLEAGLVAQKPGPETKSGSEQLAEARATPSLARVELPSAADMGAKFHHSREVDWARTKAMAQRSCHVYVNLKGRDPQGIVEPADYDSVQDEIINALYDYTDPTTGKKPVTLALKRKDARILNLGGDYCGDVVYALRGDHMGQHGPHLATEQYGEGGDIRSLFILTGPGVKKGVTVERTIWLQDVVPTLCYLADLPVPEQCEGAIIYQALEDPNQMRPTP